MPPVPRRLQSLPYHALQDEKVASADAPTSHGRYHSRRLRALELARRLTLALGAIVLAAWAVTGFLTDWEGPSFGQFLTPPSRSNDSFRWLDITPTKDLRFYPCFSEFLCARLLVPRDWTKPDDSEQQHAIAITALPASVPASSPEYSGPLLLNPGGPGGTGVGFIRTIGKQLHEVVGRTHTLIGFDPRGVGNTVPATSCFPSDLARKEWGLRSGGKIISGVLSQEVVKDEWARSKSLGYVCEQMEQGRYVGTPNVARDMLAIVEAAWKAAGHDGTKRGLRYWGFSYGTYLGMTFGMMFPDRVERMVLDAVGDLDDYYAGDWLKNIQDADDVFEQFFKMCSAAGPVCPFHESTPELVEARVRKLLAQLERQPIPVLDTGLSPDWVSAADLRTGIFMSLYSTYDGFPMLAKAFAEVEAGNGTTISSVLHLPLLTPYCPIEDPDAPNTGTEAGALVLCFDAPNQIASPQEFLPYLHKLQNQSEWIGGLWAQIRMSCVGLNGSALGLKPVIKPKVTTKSPILFASNELDPVTSIKNAVAMRKRFVGSGLLRQKGVGHSTISAPSKCSEGVIGAYFKDGKVAEDPVSCNVDAQPFEVGAQDAIPLGRGWKWTVPGVY